jgi:rhodanese-related sulfurtransferase
MVIDVRTAGEFVAGHLPHAVNLPLSEIEANLTRLVKDRIRCCCCTARAARAAAQPKRS